MVSYCRVSSFSDSSQQQMKLLFSWTFPFRKSKVKSVSASIRYQGCGAQELTSSIPVSTYTETRDRQSGTKKRVIVCDGVPA